MNKSVLRSAKPYWIYLILTGKKTVEVGKNFPKSEDWNKVIEMHCSKDMRSFNRIPEEDREWMRKYLGKVACRFVCDSGDDVYLDDFCSYLLIKETCISQDEIIKYVGGKWDKVIYCWNISDLKIYDTPKELREFKKPCPVRYDELYGYDCLQCDCLADNDYGGVCTNYITRPPQSWQFIEPLEELKK